MPQQHGEDPAEGGAGGDPDDVRADQRVAEDALEGGAGEREAAADQQGEQDAGQADVEDDGLLVAGPGAVDAEELSGQEADDLVGRDDVAAQRQRGEGDQQGEDGEERQAQAAREAPGPPLRFPGPARGCRGLRRGSRHSRCSWR